MHLSRRTTLAGLLAVSAAPARAAEPVTIRYATGGGVGPNEIETVIFLPYMRNNVLRRYGRDYTVDMAFTRGTPEAASLVAAGQADIATLSFAAFATAIVKGAVPDGMKIVSDNYWNGKQGYASDAVLVREDSPVKTVEDLRGRKVGVNAFGSASDLMVRIMLKKHGLDPRRDLQMVEISFANIGPALREQRIDAGIMVMPFLFDELGRGGMRSLFNAGDSLGGYPVVFQVATSPFLAKHPEAVRAFLADYLEGFAWLRQPENRETAMRITSEFTKSPVEQLDRYFMTPRDYFRSPTGCMTAADLQAPVDAMQREGLLPAAVDMGAFLDLSHLPHPC